MATIAVMWIGATGWFLAGFAGPGPSSSAEPRTVEVAMGMTGFDPAVVKVRAGEPVTFRVLGPDSPFHFDGPSHQFAVDELHIDLRFSAGDTVEATVTPTEPGTYSFYCDLCCSGRANPNMIGTLIVRG